MFGNFLQALAGLQFEPAARAREPAKSAVEKPALFGCEIERVAPIVKRLDAGKEAGVGHQLGMEAGELRRHFALDGL